MGFCRDFTSGIAKYIIFVFNLLILICAIALIALGVYYRVNNAGLDLFSISALSIAVGVLIALIAFFGCCGAIKESSCMLTTYAGILLTLFILQAVLAILAFVAVRNSDGELLNRVSSHLKNIYRDLPTNKDNLEVVNSLQQYLECCGLQGPQGAEVQNSTAGILINSCCENQDVVCTEINAFKVGCESRLTDWLESNIKIIGIIAIVFAIVELIGAGFAFYERNTIKGRREYV